MAASQSCWARSPSLRRACFATHHPSGIGTSSGLELLLFPVVAVGTPVLDRHLSAVSSLDSGSPGGAVKPAGRGGLDCEERG
jgi:hypothetical protein